MGLALYSLFQGVRHEYYYEHTENRHLNARLRIAKLALSLVRDRRNSAYKMRVGACVLRPGVL